MRCRVIELDLRVAAVRQYLFSPGQYCPNRYLSSVSRAGSLFKRQRHATLIPVGEAHSGASL